MSTTLAKNVRFVFKRLAAQASGNPGTSMLETWQVVLKAGGRGEFLEALSLVELSLDRLQTQLGSAGSIDDQMRSEGARVVSGFQLCSAPQNLPRPAAEYLKHLGDTGMAILGLLGSVLESEFPEVSISDELSSSLLEQLDQIINMIDAAPINNDLKNLLLRHARFLSWAIRNSDIVGAEGVYEAVGKALLAVDRLPGDNISTDSDDADASVKVEPSVKGRFSRFLVILGRGMRAADATDHALTALPQLGHDAANVIHEISKAL